MKNRKHSSDLKLNCYYCKCIFFIRKNQYDRIIREGRKYFFCGNKCSGIYSNKINPRKGNINNFGENRGIKKDEYYQFKYFVRRARARDKKKKYGNNITVEFLKKLWEQQKGICYFTGWNLILPEDSQHPWKESNPANASLDRIDNSKGYIEENVRFICLMANYARNIFTDEQLINFCKTVSQNNSK
jgi:hypothetical protein